MKVVEIDRSKPLREQPHTGHNRWHPDIPAIVEADPGEEVVLQTRDSLDGQFNMATTEADLATRNAGPIHPLTGPVLIKRNKVRRPYRDRIPRYPPGTFRFHLHPARNGFSQRSVRESVHREVED